jgi:hypothetical protein
MLEDITSRHLHVGAMHIDLAARSVEIAGTVVYLSPLEFELLAKFASDPVRVFNKHELARGIWRREQISGRTVEKPRLPAAHPPHGRRRRNGARQPLGPPPVADH